MIRAILGPAGSGKTYKVQHEPDPRKPILTSTTGLSAINLDPSARTIHSVLGFHNRETFEARQHKFAERFCVWKNNGYQRLVIDEISMLHAYQLEAVLDAALDAKLDVDLIGDFCQLPPVPEDDPIDQSRRTKLPVKFAFEAKHWQAGLVQVEVLHTNFRQTDDPEFAKALRALRSGQPERVDMFRPVCVCALDENFPGVTVLPTWGSKGPFIGVDDFNAKRLAKLTGPAVTFAPVQWGQSIGMDKRDLAPLTVKVGAQVMVTVNHECAGIDLKNGMLGDVIGLTDSAVTVKLRHDCKTACVVPYIRNIYEPGTEAKAEAAYDDLCKTDIVAAEQLKQNILNEGLLGSLRFMPLRIAYALTVHKTQGLTLDDVQVDVRPNFMGHPAMVYVALSRVKALDGLRIVGAPSHLRSHCRTDHRVKPFI